MDLRSVALRAVETYGRDQAAWSAVVQEAQAMSKADKAQVLDAIAEQSARAASRFARDAGVGGDPAARLLRLAATTLDASEVGWVVEDLIAAMGERRFVAAALTLTDTENRALEKVRYWAAMHLSESGRALWKTEHAANEPSS
jgi:hypothetical protein